MSSMTNNQVQQPEKKESTHVDPLNNKSYYAAVNADTIESAMLGLTRPRSTSYFRRQLELYNEEAARMNNPVQTTRVELPETTMVEEPVVQTESLLLRPPALNRKALPTQVRKQ